MSPGQLANDGGSGIGVVAQVGGFQDGSFKAVSLMKAPQGRFQLSNAVTAAMDFAFRFTQIIASRDGGHFGFQACRF